MPRCSSLNAMACLFQGIVVGLGALTVMELGTPSRTKTSVPDSFEQLTVDVSAFGDTLETADRLEVHHLQHQALVQPIITAEPIPPPDLTAVIPEAAERGTNDQKDVVRKQNLSRGIQLLTNLGLSSPTPTRLQRRSDQRRWPSSSPVVQMLSMASSRH